MPLDKQLSNIEENIKISIESFEMRYWEFCLFVCFIFFLFVVDFVIH